MRCRHSFLCICPLLLGTSDQCFSAVASLFPHPNKKDTFSLYVVMHFPFQLRSITSSCPSGAFFRYSHFWLLYGFRIGSDRIGTRAQSFMAFIRFSDRIGSASAQPIPFLRAASAREARVWSSLPPSQLESPRRELWSCFSRRRAAPHNGAWLRAAVML